MLCVAYAVFASRALHAIWQLALLAVAAWNGARYYFEVMAERERKLQAKLEREAQKPKPKLLSLASSSQRFVGFVVFLAAVIAVDLYVVHPFLLGPGH